MKRRLVPLFALAMIACGARGEHEFCREHRCNTVELAFEATEPIVEQVVTDLRRATGADVITDPYGVPVYFGPQALNPETGEQLCGHTITAWLGDEILYQEIHVATELGGCGSTWHTVAHEMIHVLAPHAEHTETGLFAEATSGPPRFDEQALGVLCSAIKCRRAD